MSVAIATQTAAAPAATQPPAPGAVRYVIVVHGIGEARYNETVLAVINRFAETRADHTWPPPSDIVSLGMACGQTGLEKESTDHPWMDFNGIPIDPSQKTTQPFYGDAATSRQFGENIRFVDMHWGDLLAGARPDVSQDPDVWLDALIARLRRKQEVTPAESFPQRSLEIVGVLRETVRLVHAVLRFKWKDFDDILFGRLLGDVELYGEYARSRGYAVRRFHDRMARIQELHHKRFGDERPARYTVIAHSLGTVMSMDALLYAHAQEHLKWLEVASRGTSFSGYCLDRKSRLPSTQWIHNVDAFVTLGSPIDKYLSLWWLNYNYLNDTTWLEKVRHKIDHYNYCEVQDPVGGNLDMACAAAAFQAVFNTVESRVYTRYAWPGLAHVAYWKDLDLFRWIAHNAVDRFSYPSSPRPNPPQWFSPRVFDQVLFITYYIIPGAVILLDIFTFTLAFHADYAHVAIVMTLVFWVTTLLGRYLINLTVWWRQTLRSHQETVSEEHHSDVNDWLGSWVRLVRTSESSMGDEYMRLRREREFRVSLLFVEYGSLVVGCILTGAYLRLYPVELPGRMLLIGFVFSATTIVWWWLFRRQDAAWRKSMTDPDIPPAGVAPAPTGPPLDPTSHAGRQPHDFLEQWQQEFWFSQDLILAGKVVAAVALSVIPWALISAHWRWVNYIRDTYPASRLFSFIFAAMTCGVVVGYMRARLNQTRRILMRDRTKSKDKRHQQLRPISFADYLGIQPKVKDDDSTGNVPPSAGPEQPDSDEGEKAEVSDEQHAAPTLSLEESAEETENTPEPAGPPSHRKRRRQKPSAK